MVGNPLRTSPRFARRGARPLLSLASLVLAGSVTLAACGGDDPAPEAEDSPDAQNTAAGATLSGQWPLTGLPAEGDAPTHPPMVVKIDNTGASNPQIGLG